MESMESRTRYFEISSLRINVTRVSHLSLTGRKQRQHYKNKDTLTRIFFTHSTHKFTLSHTTPHCDNMLNLTDRWSRFTKNVCLRKSAESGSLQSIYISVLCFASFHKIRQTNTQSCQGLMCCYTLT